MSVVGLLQRGWIHQVAYALFVLAITVAPPRVGASYAALGDCGQPATSGSRPLASDALFTLRTAVGSQSCDPCVCDVDDNGGITASDAARILRLSVGQPQTLTCPPCPPVACHDAAVPECGGTCPEGLACAPRRGNPESCECLDACELSEAPACGAACEAGLSCRSITIAATGLPPFEFCQCLPNGIHACASAEAPSCGGVCPPGTLCGLGDAACDCTPLETQRPCAETGAPACAGTCNDTTICVSNGSECACVPIDGHVESCSSEAAPTCGGVCAAGKMCAVSVDFTCSCFSPCEVGDAPACGGTCVDETMSCVPATATVGDESIDLCVCR